MPLREVLKLIYRSITTLATAAFAIGAVAAWWYATPGNQLLLISGILALLALITGLSISKLDDRDRQGETYAEIGRELRAKLPFSVRSDGTGKLDWALKPGAVTVEYAEPEVHELDATKVDEAKRMAAEGRPIEEICRMVDPAYDSKDPAHQGAFRALMRTLIERG